MATESKGERPTGLALNRKRARSYKQDTDWFVWVLRGFLVKVCSTRPSDISEFIRIIDGYFKNYGKFVRVWLANQLVFIMSDPKDIEVKFDSVIFCNNYTTNVHKQVALTSMKLITKSDEYDFIKPWLNTGLLTSTGQKWTSRRKVLTSAFHFKILEDFIEIFDKQSSILVEKLQTFEGQFNVFPLTALCALDVICGDY